ncbi:MAG: TetR/AcrR family transcriptional regulator [Defluviitaleaceae bacterium]|nr:TetR/AcrR family transcriptional regulator [Defluviitaleaceae bacterium]
MERFLAADEGKRVRIINAAMKEFRYGFKRASTDTIVRDAGISKGLLFHYFGTKETLYEFVVEFAVETLQKDFYDMVNFGQSDIIENIWQQALLRRDISDKYPYIYDFITAVHTQAKDNSASVAFLTEVYAQVGQNMLNFAYDRCDRTLFRADIDPRKAITLIIWGVNGLFEEVERRMLTHGDTDSYDVFLEELREYLNTFRKGFYK